MISLTFSTLISLDICSQADPENPLCQLTGKYKLRLDSQPGVAPRYLFKKIYHFSVSYHGIFRYNYVPLKPGLLEQCPSKAPDYLAPTDC